MHANIVGSFCDLLHARIHSQSRSTGLAVRSSQEATVATIKRSRLGRNSPREAITSRYTIIMSSLRRAGISAKMALHEVKLCLLGVSRAWVGRKGLSEMQQLF